MMRRPVGESENSSWRDERLRKYGAILFGGRLIFYLVLEPFEMGADVSSSYDAAAQSSQIVSKSRSPLLSAPHTLHLFLLSLAPKTTPKPLVPRIMLLAVVDSALLRRRVPPPLALSASSSAAALRRAIFSISSAASSASGESGIVSREEMLGERDRNEVGVEGIEEEEKETLDG